MILQALSRIDRNLGDRISSKIKNHQSARAIMKSNRKHFLFSMNNWQERISIHPNICHGKPCITGTRIMVSVILDNLADEMNPDEIVADYPPLTLIDIRAAIAYAVALARD